MNSYEMLKSHKQALKEKFGDKIQRLDRISSLDLSSELLQEIEDCIFSSETIYILEGFNFLRGLMLNRDISCLPNGFVNRLIERIPILLESKSKSVVYASLEWFVTFRKNYPNYRNVMLSFLKSDDVGEREYGLNYYETFAMTSEYEPLLLFKNDGHACQVGHAGDWEYELRDKAFLLIEKCLGKEVNRIRLNEPFEGSSVSWLDWETLSVS